MRAIAPHCRSKATDPAVVVLDECGRFAIPLLSGHLAVPTIWPVGWRKRAGAVPVITTATDANGVFAVDEWAKHQHCLVAEPALHQKGEAAPCWQAVPCVLPVIGRYRAHRLPVWNRLVTPYRQVLP